MVSKEELIKRFDDYVHYFQAYCTGDVEDHEMLKAVLALLKEQEEQIKNRDESLEKAREEIKWLRRMLKEQEAIEGTIEETRGE